MNDFDKEEMKHDLDKSMNYYPDDSLCTRCDEEESLPDNDLCEYCLDIVKEKNRDRFQAEETY